MRYLTRSLWALFVAILLVVGCSSPEPFTPAETLPPPVTTEAQADSLGAQPVIPLSYSIRKAQEATANELRRWWQDASEGLFGGYWPMSCADWSINDQTCGDGSGLALQVTFGWRGFTPDSHIDYGPATVGGETQVQLGDASYLIDNRRGSVAVPFQRQVAVTYQQSATATLSATIEVDTGTEVGARVGNPTTPAGMEAKITAGLKISGSTSNVSGWSTNRTETQTIGPVQVPAGHALLAAISAPNVRLTQAMTVAGEMDMSVSLSWLNVAQDSTNPAQHQRHIQGWSWRNWPTTDCASFVPCILGSSSRASDDGTRTTVTFDSLSEFVSFLQGYDTKVSAGLDRDNGASHADAIISASTITWAGTVHRETENSTDYTFTDVAPDEVAATIARQGIDSDRVVDVSAAYSKP